MTITIYFDGAKVCEISSQTLEKLTQDARERTRVSLAISAQHAQAELLARLEAAGVEITSAHLQMLGQGVRPVTLKTLQPRNVPAPGWYQKFNRKRSP